MNDTAKSGKSIGELFETVFWPAYPRRVGKKAAFEEFARVARTGEVSFERLMGAVNAYTMATIHQDIQYIAHPATWLAQGRWDDEVDTRPTDNTYWIDPVE